MEGELRCERLSSPLHDSGNNEYFLSEESLLYPSLPPQRRNANYKPSLWADSYIQSLPDGALATAQVEQWEELKEEIRHLIKSVDVKEDEVEELLCLFDTLRQLGASYHFEREIKSALSFIASSSEGSLCNNALKNNLYGSALLFRLLREYCIDDQNQTKYAMLRSIQNESGSFDVGIVTDAKAILSLYEASYLAMEGESELDDAGEFTAKHLSDYVSKPLLANGDVNVNPLFVEQINHALEIPLHRRTCRLHSAWFIKFYERLENMNPKLLQFAKLDFNLLQSIYKKEIKALSKWWESLGLFGEEFSFSRNRVVENYYSCLECSFEPQFWRSRIEVAKFSNLVTIIDDIYDIYGSLEELVIFTNAIQEWRVTAEVQHLPNCMKKSLMAIFSTVYDIASNFSSEKGIDIFPQLQQIWKYQCKAYFLEAKWYNAKYTPTLNEFLGNAYISSVGPLLETASYCFSESLNKEALHRIEYKEDILRYSSTLARLYNDWSTSTSELPRGDIPKSIQCYMKEKNVSESTARYHMKNLIEKYWKKLNGQYFSAFNLEESYKRFVLNLPRLTIFLYYYGDRFAMHHCETKDTLNTLIVEPIPL